MSKAKKGKPVVRPQDLEKRLETAYNSGYYDGFVEGIMDAHKIWVAISSRTKGVGPKIQKALIETAKVVMAERNDEKFGKPPEDVEYARAALEDWPETNQWEAKENG